MLEIDQILKASTYASWLRCMLAAAAPAGLCGQPFTVLKPFSELVLYWPWQRFNRVNHSCRISLVLVCRRTS